jgi:hypothetical protein
LLETPKLLRIIFLMKLKKRKELNNNNSKQLAFITYR